MSIEREARPKTLARLIRRVWCRRRHPWLGWEMTEAERELYRSPSMLTGSWHRNTCRWCRGRDDEMPKKARPWEREQILNEAAFKQIGFNARIGRVSHALSPGYGSCYRCKTTWAFVQGHSTMYNEHSGCFPLCEACWAELTPDERLPYYRRLLIEWKNGGYYDGADDEAIESAVLAGR